MKVTPLRHGILAMALLSGPTVWAQQASPTAEQWSVEASSSTREPAPPPAPATVQAAHAAGSVDTRVAALEARLAKDEENAVAVESNVSSLRKLKFIGYVQGRYEWHQNAVDGWEDWKNENRFSVRHGYLGARYEGTYGEYFLQIDGNTSDGLVLKDAEASLIEPWTPLKIKLTIGQFKLPFGYEIGQSDADRELPERAAVITGLFVNDRDRGLRLQTKYEVLRFSAALVNGANLFKKDFKDKAGFVQNGYVPNGFKTVVGRLGVDLGFLVGGLSGLWGRTLETGDDPGKDNWDYRTYKKYEQTRLGADLQTYFDLPGVGGLALKGEVIWARKKNLDYSDLKSDPCRDSRNFGWIVTLVQNIGDHAGVAVRLDQYDPLLSGSVPGSCVDKAKKGDAVDNRDGDRLTRLGVAALLHASANTKFTLSYEHPWEQSGAKANDIVVAQMQARF
jgi:hypothetical protein